MNRKNKDSSQDQAQPLPCADCREGLQEYLDGTLPKQTSLRFFLHLRDCEACREHQVALQGLFKMLDSLPAQEVPADFDDAILASVPYAAYRAMEPLRRERVPVYLAEHFLPGFVRSRITRASGLGFAVTVTAFYVSQGGPLWMPVVAGLGALPEVLVRLQGLGRWLVTSERVES